MFRNLIVSTALATCLCLSSTGCQQVAPTPPAPSGTDWDQVIDEADALATPDVPDLPDDFRR